MSKLALKIAVDKVLDIAENATNEYTKHRVATDIFYDILEPLVEVEEQSIIDAYNKGREDCKHERPIENYNAKQYYEYLRNLH
jgi:predicted kinase